jgi:hypothetical protein
VPLRSTILAANVGVMYVMNKIKQYKKIINARNTVLILAVSIPVAAFISAVLTDNENIAALVGGLGVVLVFIGSLRMQALNVCPWCLKPFLYKVGSIKLMCTQSRNWLYCKTCAYCEEPNEK